MQRKSALLLLLFYAFNLVTFRLLLSNPFDNLTGHSFPDLRANPDVTSNCLILLAMQEGVRAQKKDTYKSVSFSLFPVSFNQDAAGLVRKIVNFGFAFSKPVFEISRYKLFAVFRI
jgi:hypothetical protein